MKRMLFITSTNLAANPRLVKELSLAIDAGYDTTVVQFSVGNWSDGLTTALQQRFQNTAFISLSALRSPFFPWLWSSLLQKFYNSLPVSFLTTEMLSIVTGKRSWILLRFLKKVSQSYDWVIAHNPGAFYPAYVYSQRSGAKLGIDVEDYHPGETTFPKQQQQMLRLMQLLLPKATYCSYAAPLIAAEVQKNIPGMLNKQLVLLNGFLASEFIAPELQTGNRLKLVWFSQNIDSGRGLEEVIPAVNELHSLVELHLIGYLQPQFAEMHLKNRNGIVLHDPMPQHELHTFLATCDVGLATDVPVNKNRELALTNKILAYAQAGLYILSFPVQAQLDFLKTYQLHYSIMNNSCAAIVPVLTSLNKDFINAAKAEQFTIGMQFDWKKLGRPLVETWQQ
ncbi:glycosyltransferase family protein [Lacibacter sediminis]|uniref:Glycosyltransferase n=1 Tax=Lacibacter sediminis TaxID=2760713 RepID=A0A7G5XHQ3_9BACT|nr:hypothetical protein [Lacibacter sediminis]QNA45006.1 hypothetical protein H4075_02085 [Lacibacter sediminis]